MLNRSKPKNIQNSTDAPAALDSSESVALSNIDAEYVLDQENNEEFRCGWCNYKPNWIQLLNNKGCALFTLTCAAFLQGTIINGMLPIMITSIEKRFNLQSVESGFISGAFNFSSLICLVPVTYFGGRPNASKPHWIGFGMIIMGIGSLLFSLPHFITTPQYSKTNGNPNYLLCKEKSSGTNMCQKKTNTPLSSFMWVLVTANLLHGAGSSPLFTLGVAFIDESVAKNKSGLILAVYYIGGTMGIAFGYFIGGYFLQIHEDLSLSTPVNQHEVGAWWLGFFLFGLLSIFLSIPILAIPAKLPDLDREKEGNVSEVVLNRERTVSFVKASELPSALKELVNNRSFMLLNFAGCCEGLLISGCNTFIPKILHTQFNISTKTGSMVMGIIAIPSVVLGMISGGLMLKKFGLKFVEILKLCMTTTSLSMICTCGFLISCSNENLVGINLPYKPNEKEVKLDNPCNVRCQCSSKDYFPICGANNNTYYSPCYAGCQQAHSSTQPGVTLYSNCDCVEDKWTGDIQASDQPCASGFCILLPLFLLLVYLTLYFTFINAMPTLSATLRCVKEDQRSLALGIQWMLVRLLGMIPGPVVFGAILDAACEQWNMPNCDSKEGSCVFYDNDKIGWSIVLLAYHLKTLEIFLFMLSIYFYKKASLRSRI